mmetsp:Transcript_105567/g.281168  ORF Transcript_105567/g.281168 Transcript_105567/m.281168 type:complete len:216 (-) Transcript_105567:374-1021(-)
MGLPSRRHDELPVHAAQSVHEVLPAWCEILRPARRRTLASFSRDGGIKGARRIRPRACGASLPVSRASSCWPDPSLRGRGAASFCRQGELDSAAPEEAKGSTERQSEGCRAGRHGGGSSCCTEDFRGLDFEASWALEEVDGACPASGCAGWSAAGASASFRCTFSRLEQSSAGFTASGAPLHSVYWGSYCFMDRFCLRLARSAGDKGAAAPPPVG